MEMKPKQYAERCLRDEAQALLALIPQLDDSFDQVVELIHRCDGHVVVTGVGKSGHVGAKIAATLASTGTPASLQPYERKQLREPINDGHSQITVSPKSQSAFVARSITCCAPDEMMSESKSLPILYLSLINFVKRLRSGV